MVRPSGNTDKKLIQAAIALFPETGFTNLKVRDVAKKAGVNLGMFHYHFKNKEEFIRHILIDVYEQFFNTFQLETSTSDDPELRLRNAIRIMGKFFRENRKMIIPLINDVLFGNKEIQQFLAVNMQRHMKILLKIIKDCQKQGVIGNYPLDIILPFILGVQVAPSMIADLLEKTKISLPMELAKIIIAPKLISTKAVETRLDLALKALRPEPMDGHRKKVIPRRRKK